MIPIKDYEDFYSIDSNGQVYRKGKAQPLLPGVNPQNGYLYVSLWKDNVGKSFSVHRLVAKHFIPNPEQKPFVNHLDSNRQNPKASNLAWCTHSENIQHGYDYGFMSQEARRRFTEYEMTLHLEAFLSGISITMLAAQAHCSLSRLSINLKKMASKLNKLFEYTAELKRQKVSRNRAAAITQRKAIQMFSLNGEFIKSFRSLGEAAKYLNKTSTGSISNALNPNHPQKKGYGYLWKYL